MTIQSKYQRAIAFAGSKHAAQQQVIPGSNLPYTVHISNVAMEILAATHDEKFNIGLAVQLALLHDVLEDTATTREELEQEFDSDVVSGVQALTKNEALPANEKMEDSLRRIRLLTPEVWAVKLADRITNLQEPPAHWDNNKKKKYVEEARVILATLAGASQYLENRLAEKITAYQQYIL